MTLDPKRVAHRHEIRLALQIVEGRVARGPSGRQLLWEVSETALRDADWFDKTFKSGLTPGQIRKWLPLFDQIAEESEGRIGPQELDFLADALGGDLRRPPTSIANLPSVRELVRSI